MTPRFGIDTSILVRLATGLPDADFQRTLSELKGRVEAGTAEFFASNLVVAEAFMVLRHHYSATADDSRAALHSVLSSGLVSPVHGLSVRTALERGREPGLVDRLIVIDYGHHAMETLTLDRRMAGLPDARLL